MGRKKKKHIDLESLCDDVRCVLADNDIELTRENEIQYGFQIFTTEAVILNIYVTGKIVFAGNKSRGEEIRKMFVSTGLYKYV